MNGNATGRGVRQGNLRRRDFPVGSRCLGCRREYDPYSRRSFRRGGFCSDVCMALANTVIADVGVCWPWGGHALRLSPARQINPRKVLWEGLKGPLPEGYRVGSHCGNPRCMNPAHLFAAPAFVVRGLKRRWETEKEKPDALDALSLDARWRLYHGRGSWFRLARAEDTNLATVWRAKNDPSWRVGLEPPDDAPFPFRIEDLERFPPAVRRIRWAVREYGGSPWMETYTAQAWFRQETDRPPALGCDRNS